MVIAILALLVSIAQTRITQKHNRQSVRPILQVRRQRTYEGPTAGIRLANKGLGPAVITRTEFAIDGEHVGQWRRGFINTIRDQLFIKASQFSLSEGTTLEPGSHSYLLYVTDYDHDEHPDFWDLIFHRMRLVIHYESIYGGENYCVVMEPQPRQPD